VEKRYSRSFGDRDTHRCEQTNADGTVTARCGLTFMPQHRLFGDGPMWVRPLVEPVLACRDAWPRGWRPRTPMASRWRPWSRH
jgi:hypothetical protein